ncbi:thiol-disulfide oxidoreductase DCC family protein [bacterium]|nr:MAG: thiol-disulfide oxidoreductase DCC family protein [bacterium]
MEEKHHSIVYFDGVCNLCNASVDFIIKRDLKAKFKFASLQSDLGQKILQENQFNSDDYDSFILEQNGNVYIKSSAAIRVAMQIGFPWSLLGVFLAIPPFIRNIVYSFIAKNRYKWFGKKETCRLPTPEERARFIA